MLPHAPPPRCEEGTKEGVEGCRHQLQVFASCSLHYLEDDDNVSVEPGCRSPPPPPPPPHSCLLLLPPHSFFLSDVPYRSLFPSSFLSPGCRPPSPLPHFYLLTPYLMFLILPYSSLPGLIFHSSCIFPSFYTVLLLPSICLLDLSHSPPFTSH